MNNNNSDFSTRPKYYSDYYPLSSIPETMFLIETECLKTTTEKTNDPQSSVKGVMFALGIIITLIVGSTWHLYRSLKTTPVQSQITPATEFAKILSPEKKQNPLTISQTAIAERTVITNKNHTIL